jgi:hypothetical protein
MTSTHSHRVSVSVPRLATAIIVALTLANTAQPANAVSAYLTAFETQYPAAVGSRIDTCNVCHTTVPQLNPYGMAFQDAGHEFAPIESSDSDGDGASNLAEIMALTFPGDPADTPPAAPSATPTVTLLAETATPTVTVAGNDTPTITPTGSLAQTSTVTPTGSLAQTPTVTPTGSLAQTPTNTSGGGTVTPTTPSASPGTPTVTPSRGSATVSPTTSAARTATGAVSPTTSAARTATSGPFPSSEDDGCSIAAPARSRTGGGLALLLVPALLLWARRRRL